MTTRMAIDLNVRVRVDQTYAGFEDVDGPLTKGDTVRVYEPETGWPAPRGLRRSTIRTRSSTSLSTGHSCRSQAWPPRTPGHRG